MRKILALIVALLVPSAAFAQALENDLIGLGMSPELAERLSSGDVVVTRGDLSIVTTGKTIEYETGTAASACMGTSTFNGTTAVTVSTTCATTGSKIFFSPTSDGSGTPTNDQSGCWATNISNGVSFDLDCSDAAMSSTLNWVIYHEAP